MKLLASPWRGHSRRPLRVALAIAAIADALVLAVAIARTPPGARSHPAAPDWLLGIGDAPRFLFGLVFLLGGAGYGFARRRASLACGLAALAGLALLAESHAALVGGPARSFFASGALLLAWVAGAALARALAPASGELCAVEDRFGEAAAVAVFAAMYVAAGMSKLLASGTAWADETTLRGIILSHHRVDDASWIAAYARAVAESPGLGQALAAATLVVQLGAMLLLAAPRWRLVWAALLIGFHLNTLLLAGILYLENALLLLAFALPWPAILGRPRPDEPPPTFAPTRVARVLAVAFAVVALLILLGYALPIRDYTALHHRPGVG
jgi:hypothetical protein